MTLQQKNILIGISGGIAAYKIPELVRRLKEQGANVRVVMTESAKAFITPLTLQAVSGYAVSDSLLDTSAELAMGHIELAKWADLVIIAPASANTIAKLAYGFADNLLTTLCIATTAPIAIVPAMNQAMWHNVATLNNVRLLTERGITCWGPAQGEQACGDVGFGRMIEVNEIVSRCQTFFAEKPQPLAGQHWLITAGPTREAIDPVRYISNHSSGKMGFAIAQAAQQLGAIVTIIAGPVQLPTPQGCNRIDVTSASDMHQQTLALAPHADIFVACAAVADYRLETISEHKLKKTAEQDTLTLTLVKNPDIVADVAALDLSQRPFVVGFAAETQQVKHYAQDKLQRKNLDLIAANDVSNPEQGFNSDHNALWVFSQASEQHIPHAPKAAIAKQLVEIINTHYQAKQGN
jgi:phosphopantothenoylcysteine decarboxylase/phosphopantothenate--cysteine ligase